MSLTRYQRQLLTEIMIAQPMRDRAKPVQLNLFKEEELNNGYNYPYLRKKTKNLARLR